jgi:hypothetical protein
MHVMALLARGGWVRDWSAHAQKLKRMADWLKGWGTDHGAMHVAVTGILANATQHTRTWHLLATDGDGPYVPTLAAAALIRQLREAGTLPMGAVPCIGLLSLDAFVREAEGLRIHMAEATA